MRSLEWENKNIQKPLQTHNQDMMKVRKETKKKIGETTRGLIKEFTQVKQTIEKCESWQQEIDNKWTGLRKPKRKTVFLYSCLLKVIMRATST
jgi:hypothetical protein